MNTARATMTRAGQRPWQSSSAPVEAKLHQIQAAPSAVPGFEVRRATIEDAEAIAQLFQVVYSQSSHPCKNPQVVKETFKTGGDLWFVGVAGQRVVACTAQSRQLWNGTYESCRSVTLPECRGSGLGSILYKRALDLASQEDDFGFCFGNPRTLSMLRILRDTDIPFVILGHDGAMNIANGKREYHLVGMTGNRRQPITRVIPPKNRIATSKFVQERIIAPLGIKTEIGAYPTSSVIGPAGGQEMVIRGVTFAYRFQEDMPNKALEILGMESLRASPEESAQALGEFLERFPSALHVSATVLVDKVPLLKALRKMGFEITAYLPVYYLLAQRRYDCVMLVKRSFTEEPVTHETADLVEAFRDGLAAQL